jgi:signal recognition particle subunit SRP54
VRHDNSVLLRLEVGSSENCNLNVSRRSPPIFSCSITEQSIKPALRDVRRALLEADVNIEVADTLIDGVKKRSLGVEVLKGVTADQQFIKAMYDELLDMMGGDSSTSSAETIPMGGANGAPAATLAVGRVGDPAVILLAGLQGAGKTTAAGKLALYLKEREVDYSLITPQQSGEEAVLSTKLPKRGRKVLLAAADVYRPAAIKQLQILGESIGVEVFSLGTDADPVDIAAQAVAKAKAEGFDTVLVDTAGRQAIDADLMDELKRIKAAGKFAPSCFVCLVAYRPSVRQRANTNFFNWLRT